MSNKTLQLNVTVKGSVTPEQMHSLQHSIVSQIAKYLLTIPVVTKELPREMRPSVEEGSRDVIYI